MRLLLVADGRSPTARSWISNIQQGGHQVALISSYPCDGLPDLAEFHILPLAFSNLTTGRGYSSQQNISSTGKRKLVTRIRPLLMDIRYALGPLTLPAYIKRYQMIIDHFAPELIHALRIPFEGMLAQAAPDKYPFVISIWGNDLTLHANGSLLMNRLTNNSLDRVDGLMADANRDIRLAANLGYDRRKPSLVIPGCGGIDLQGVDESRMLHPKNLLPLIPQDRRLIVNPRGLRPGSLRSDIFFQAIRMIADKYPDVYFVCPAMAGQREAETSVSRLHLENTVLLLPPLSQPELWWLYSRAEMFISPGAHDGVPNSFLEGLAAGCFPVVGDIESMREWITPGINGLLYPVDDPRALRDAICLILDNPARRHDAARVNRKLINARADRTVLREQISSFYKLVASS